MALGHADGFSHYGAAPTRANAQAAMIADGYSEVGATEILPSGSGGIPAEDGTGCMLNFWQYQGGISKPFVSALKQGGQVALWFNKTPQFDNWGYRLYNGATAFLNVLFKSDMTVVVSTNSDPTVTAAYLGVLKPGYLKLQTWQKWEFVYTPNTGAGTVGSPYNGQFDIYQFGVPLLSIRGLNISTGVTAHYMGCPFILGSSPDIRACNWIINDVSGAGANICPLGPRKVGTRIVSANGANNAWVANGAASNWQCVAKAGPDTSSYIEAANPGDLQDFIVPASINAISGVTGVIIKGYMQKTNTGAGTAKLGVQSGLTLANSPELPLGTGYSYYGSGFFDIDPNTLGAWTPAAYNSIGVRVSRVQ